MSTLPPLAPWQQRACAQACEALAQGHFGHATLIAGPARIGKRLLAETLAQRVLCQAPAVDGSACGSCKSCRLFAVRAQMETPELRPDGSLAHPWGHSAHPDLYFLGFEINSKTGKPRAEIVIEQVRALTEKMGLTAQLGGAQVVIVEPADAVNWHAWNAILKTLEEPQSGRYLWLLSAQPSRLPATIRSRCQRLELRLPPREEALAWLHQRGHSETLAREALEAARGHPGLADAWASGDGLALRREVHRDADALQRGQADAGELAQRWVADGRASERLGHLADRALHEAAGLTGSAATRRLAARFDAANRARDLLRSTVRADLTVLEALLLWR
ncbi:MAG: DNA polymerase III subunit delta' [Xanthomonadaceae bacterium]|nr:DNA polymerase III subunit delta' [Xanthomonadaceae bacterium]